MPRKPTLTVQVGALQENQAELAGALRELVTCVEVLAVAARNPGSVPQEDLETNLTALETLRSRIAAIGGSEAR